MTSPLKCLLKSSFLIKFIRVQFPFLSVSATEYSQRSHSYTQEMHIGRRVSYKLVHTRLKLVCHPCRGSTVTLKKMERWVVFVVRLFSASFHMYLHTPEETACHAAWQRLYHGGLYHKNDRHSAIVTKSFWMYLALSGKMHI